MVEYHHPISLKAEDREKILEEYNFFYPVVYHLLTYGSIVSQHPVLFVPTGNFSAFKFMPFIYWSISVSYLQTIAHSCKLKRVQ